MAIHLVSDNTLNKKVERRKPQSQRDITSEELQQTLRLSGLLQTSLELESILATLHRIQKDVYYLDGRDIRTLLGRVNLPLENFIKNLNELNEKAKKLS